MNKLDLFKYRNNIASYVKSFHTKRNVVNLNIHNSVQHEMIKARICYLLKAEGKEFFTEVPLQASARKECKADILVLDEGRIIEVMVSETLEQVQHKTLKYPKFLEIIAVTDWSDLVEGSYKLIRGKEV